MFNSSVQTLEIQFDLVALAKDKNKDQPHRIDVLPGCNLLMEENSRILCSPLADTEFFAFYVMLHKEDENVILSTDNETRSSTGLKLHIPGQARVS